MTHTQAETFKRQTGDDLFRLKLEGAISEAEYHFAIDHLQDIKNMYHDRLYQNWDDKLLESIALLQEKTN